MIDEDFSDFMPPDSFSGPEVDPDDFPDFPVAAEPPEQDESNPPPLSMEGIDLLTPPGFAGDVTRWIDSQCIYPRRRLAVASALVTIGNCGGLRHVDTFGRATANMIAFCVAASSTGKEAVMQATSKLHRAAGTHYAMQGGIKSEQEIMRNLIEHQAAYYVVDEIGILLTKIRNAQKRGGAAYLEGIFGTVMSAYSKANSFMPLNGDTRRELRKEFMNRLSAARNNDDDESAAMAERMLRMVDEGLERPFLSVIGFTTPGTFDSVMDGETATQGFIGRALLVTEQDLNPRARDNVVQTDVPSGMAMRLSAMVTGGTAEPYAFRGRLEHAGPLDPIETDDDAQAAMIACREWFLDYADFHADRTGEASIAMIRRSYELMSKVSFVLAMGDGRRTLDHVRWAYAYVRHEVDMKIALVYANDNARQKPDAALGARLRGYMDPVTGTTTAVLANRTKRSVEEVERVLGMMLEMGSVTKGPGKYRKKGKLTEVWRPVAE